MPSKRVNLFTSAREVLRSSLGRFWPLFLLLLVVVMLGPTIIYVFAGKIELDPALFVTEWLHLSIEGVFFFFILEIVRHRSLSFTAHQSLVRFVTLNYEGPATVIIDSIEQFSKVLNGDQSIDRNEMLGRAWSNWAVLERALSDDALKLLPSTAALEVWLMRNSLKLERRKALLNSISSVRYAGELVQAEYDEFLRALGEFLNSSERLHC